MTPTFRYPPQSLLLDANLIDDSSRTRQDYGDLSSLAESIAQNGLIHPPVVDTHNRLIAGGRRFRAIRDVLKATQIPVLVLETLDDAHLAILEAEENIRRKALTWQERVLGVAKVHEVSKRGAVLNSNRWTIVETGEMLGISFSNVNNALTLARYIRSGDVEINKCVNISDALKLLILRREREALKRQAELLTAHGVSAPSSISQDAKDLIAKIEGGETDEEFFSTVPVGGLQGVGVISPLADADELPGVSGPNLPQTEVPLSKLIHKGKMEDLCYSVLGAESVDHVITDWPYGIDMANLDTIEGIEDVKAEHDVASNIADFPRWIAAVDYVLRPGGFFITWYDLDHHEKIQTLCRKQGFSVQRWPLIWYKTHSCRNSAANKNFTKNYECALVCRKGNATLLSPQQSSVWAGTNDDLKVTLGHPFVKPLKLWQWVFNAVAMRGQCVLDPFAGVGSSTIAAIAGGLLPIAFESNDDHYNRLIINTGNAFRQLNPNTKFI